MSLLLYLEPNLFEDGNGLLILDMHHSNSFLLDIFPMSLECWKQLFCSVGHIIIPKHLPYELPLPSSTRKWISIKPKETWEKKKGRKGPLIWRGWICSFFFFSLSFLPCKQRNINNGKLATTLKWRPSQALGGKKKKK